MQSENKPLKRIGIIIFDYVLGYSANVINSALMLEREGYEVTIFIDAASYERSKIDFRNKNIKIQVIDFTRRNEAKAIFWRNWEGLEFAFSSRGAFRRLKLYQPGTSELYLRVASFFCRLPYKRETPSEKLYKQTATFFPDLSEFQEKLASAILHYDYVCLLAIDAKSLVAATIAGGSRPQAKRVPVIYYSMELLLEKNANRLHKRILRLLERHCAELCDFIVIQDEARAALFVKDKHVTKEKLIYLPVSGLRDVYRGKGNYFRQLFGISANKKILLHAGGFLGTLSLEIAEVARDWGNDLVLILHAPSLAWVDKRYLKKLRGVAAREKNVYLSLTPVAWEKVPELISSADIGLIFYENGDPNMSEIGRSSNKLVQYLEVGLPIIGVDFPSLKRVLQEFQCGETTHNLDEIDALAHYILQDYKTYRNHAFKCYADRYQFSDYFCRVLERIREIE